MIWALIDALPLSVASAVTGFSAVSLLLLLLGRLNTLLVMLLAVPAATFLFIYVTKQYSRSDVNDKYRSPIVTLFVVGLIVLWVVFNLFYSSQNIYTYRDPAVYTVTAEWLTKHEHLEIKVPKEFTNIKYSSPSSSGFATTPSDTSRLFAQGAHLLPLLVGLSGRLVGEEGMLRANVVFGGLALLTFYGFGRCMLRPKWAVYSTVILGMTLPLIYFSRDMYSEPLALFFVFGSLSLIWLSQQTGSKGLWFVSGLAVGAGAMTRTDAYLMIIGIVAFLGIWLLLAEEKHRRDRLTRSIIFATGILLTTILGWLDLRLLSTPYYLDLRLLITRQLIVIGLILIAVMVGVIIAWKTNFIEWLNRYTKKSRAVIIVLFLTLCTGILFTRPFWYNEFEKYDIAIIGGQQAPTHTILNAPVRGENVTLWVVWYLGLPLVLLGVVGLLISLRKNGKNNLFLVPFQLVFIAYSLLYFSNPNITPDQVWAVRRFLPVVIPGLILFAVLTSQVIFYKYVRNKNILAKLIFITILAVQIVPILKTTRPFVGSRTFAAQLGQIHTVCNSLPDNAVVLWVGSMNDVAVQPTRTFCDVSSIGLDVVPSPGIYYDFAQRAYKANLVPVIGVVFSERAMVTNYEKLTELNRMTYKTVEQSIGRPPDNVIINERAILTGVLDDKGHIKTPNAVDK